MNKYSVLLVDDEESIRVAIRYTLQKAGYDVTVAESGEEAIGKLTDNHFDIVVTDLIMEGMDGIEVLKKALSLCPDILVTIITGHGSLPSAVDALRLGAFDYMLKPCSNDELLFRMGKCVEKLESQRKLKEKNLQILKLSKAAEQSPATIMITDAQGIIEYVNPYFAQLTGYTPEEAIGKNPRFLKSGEHSQDFYKGLWDTITSGKLWRGEFHNKKKNGELYWELTSISPIKNLEGVITNFIAVKGDITERKQMEEQMLISRKDLEKALSDLRQTQSVLVRSEKLACIGTLSAGVAHEILNPLNIISIMVQNELMGDLPDKTRETLKEILLQVKRATKITNNLRMFAHQKKDEVGAVDIHKLFDKTATLIERDLNLDNINIVKNYDPNLPVIYADEDKLAQIFLNLLTNSRDSMKGRKNNSITIKTQTVKDGVKIIFSDTGPGIPGEITHKIFDPFFTTKEPGQGTGLGLSLVHSFIESHGGAIHVESKEGKGTTFVIFLPIKNKTKVDHNVFEQVKNDGSD